MNKKMAVSHISPCQYSASTVQCISSEKVLKWIVLNQVFVRIYKNAELQDAFHLVHV